MVAFIEKQINLNTSKTFIQYEKFTEKDKEILAGAEALNEDVLRLLWSDNVTIVKQQFINSDFYRYFVYFSDATAYSITYNDTSLGLTKSDKDKYVITDISIPNNLDEVLRYLFYRSGKMTDNTHYMLLKNLLSRNGDQPISKYLEIDLSNLNVFALFRRIAEKENLDSWDMGDVVWNVRYGFNESFTLNIKGIRFKLSVCMNNAGVHCVGQINISNEDLDINQRNIFHQILHKDLFTDQIHFLHETLRSSIGSLFDNNGEYSTLVTRACDVIRNYFHSDGNGDCPILMDEHENKFAILFDSSVIHISLCRIKRSDQWLCSTIDLFSTHLTWDVFCRLAERIKDFSGITVYRSDFPKLDEHMLYYKLLNKMQLEAITALNQNHFEDKVYMLIMDSETSTIKHGRILFTKKDEDFEIIAVI